MSEIAVPVVNLETTTYRRSECVVFLKVNDMFGAYSNMAPGFPLRVDGERIRTSEALYQACRFPDLPDVQRVILAQANPRIAKMKSKPHRKHSRPDFDELRVAIMWWALRVKLACNFAEFGRLLRASRDKVIVEQSARDGFWGAIPQDADTLTGKNILGQLLMKLRDIAVDQKGREDPMAVDPPGITNFLLFGQPIGQVVGVNH